MIRPKLQDYPKYDPESYTCPHCNEKVGNQQHHFCREMWHEPEKEYISKDHQVLSEAWKITSTDKNGGDYHEHEHNIKDWYDAVARVAKKFIPFFTGRKFKVEPHNDVHEASEAPEYYEHIDDIDHERIVKHAEDVIKRIDYILKIYDKHEHKLDNKQFKQVRKHKNQLNKIKTMITSELERHKKQALDEGVFNKIRGGVVGGALGAYLGTLPAGLLGGLSDLVVPGSIGPVAAGTWAAATAGGASLGTTFAADSDVYETHKNYTNAVKRSQEPEKKSWFGYVSSKPSQETLDRLYDKHVRAVKAYNAITPFSNDQYPIERKLHEESLLPNILKPSRNTDASGYARYISEQNSSSNLRSKPINEGHRHAGAIVGAAGSLIDLSSSAIALGAGLGATALTGNPAVGTATTIGVKALAVGDDAIKGWRQGRMTDIENGIRKHKELIKKHGDENHPEVLRNKDKTNSLIAAHNTAFKRNDYATLNEAKFIKSTEHDYEPFNDKNAYRITDILKSKKFKHESSRGNSHIYVHVNGSKVLLTKSGSGAITGLTHIDSNGKRTLFARKAEGVGQTEIDVKRFQKHLSSLNEGYKYTEVKPQGYEEHKAKILNFLSQYGKASIADIGGLAGPDDLELHKHYEPGFIGRTLGWQKTEPQKIASSYTTFILKHPTDPNQHMEVSYTVGGEEYSRAGWRLSVKTPHLMKFAHIIKGHPNRGSENEVYVSEGKSPYATNTDGINESLPHLKKYINNHFLTNKPIVNVR